MIFPCFLILETRNKGTSEAVRMTYIIRFSNITNKGCDFFQNQTALVGSKPR